MNLYPAHKAELDASGISPEIQSRYFYSTAGEPAQEWLIENVLKTDGHAAQYVTAANRGLLERSEHVKAGGWICRANGQIKPDEPRPAKEQNLDGTWEYAFNDDGTSKRIKYESKREKPYRGAHVSLMQPIGQPRMAADGSRLVVITEGGKKGGALATAGYEAIPLPGVDMAMCGDEKALIPVLANLVVEECTFIIAFDADSKLSTRKGVARSAKRLGEALVKHGASVRVAKWKPKAGKGIDDVLVKKGVDFVHQVLDNAATFEDWLKKSPKKLFQVDRTETRQYKQSIDGISQKLGQYTELAKADVVLNQRYLDKGVLPEPGSVIVVDSPMDTGKTSSFLGGICEEHRTRYPDSAAILSGSRNLLIRQTGGDLGFLHWSETDGDPSLAKHQRLAACIESLTKLSYQRVPANSLFVIDEFIAYTRHLFGSSTLKDGADRIIAIRALKSLISKVLSGGGWVICMEANVLQWAVDCLHELLPRNATTQVIRNEYAIEAKSPVYVYKSLNTLKQRQREMVEAGARIVAASDSAGQIDNHYRELYATENDFHISAKNSAEPDVQQFALNPVIEILGGKGCRVFSFSPSIGAGVSVSDPKDGSQLFDAKVGIFTHLTSSDAAQQSYRYRTDVPMHVYVAQRGRGISDKDFSIFDPEKLREKWTQGAEYLQNLLDLAGYLSGQNGESLRDNFDRSYKGEDDEVNFILKWRSIIEACDNFDRLHLRENLIARYKQRGHQIIEVDDKPGEGVAAEFKELREKAEIKDGEEFAAVPLNENMNEDEAHAVLSANGYTRAETLEARKVLYSREFPHADFDNAEFCTDWLVKGRGKKLSNLRTEWAARNPAKAKARDRWKLKGKLKQSKNISAGIVAADITAYSPKADLMAKSALPDAIDAIANTPYTEDHSEVVRVANWSKKHSKQLYSVMRMRVKEDHTNIDIFNRLSRQLGYAPKVDKHTGCDGRRQKQYVLSDFSNPDRGHMLKSLSDRFCKQLEEKGETLEGKRIETPAEWGVSEDELKARRDLQMKQTAITPNLDGEEWITWDDDEKKTLPLEPVAAAVKVPVLPISDELSDYEWDLVQRLELVESRTAYAQVRQELEAINPDFNRRYWTKISDYAQTRINGYCAIAA